MPEETDETPKNEAEFWQAIDEYDESFLKPEPIVKKTSNIESAVAYGTSSTYKQLEKATNIDENVIRAFAKYGDHPFLGPIIMRYIIAQRHNNGWIVEKLREFYELHRAEEINETWKKKFIKFAEKVKGKMGMI
jgi:hypothetical protein